MFNCLLTNKAVSIDTVMTLDPIKHTVYKNKNRPTTITFIIISCYGRKFVAMSGSLVSKGQVTSPVQF